MACIRWTSRDNNDSIYPCVNSINNGKYAYDNIQMFVTTWNDKFTSNWNMQTEAYYTYQRDVPSVFGPLPIESNTNGAVCPFGQLSCFAPAWAVVNYQNFKFSKKDYFVLRNEYFDDTRGQRTGTQTRYSTHSIGWGHWFNVWGDDTRYCSGTELVRHSYNAPAYDHGTKEGPGDRSGGRNSPLLIDVFGTGTPIKMKSLIAPSSPHSGNSRANEFKISQLKLFVGN